MTLKVYTREEATTIERPEGRPWSWGDVPTAIIQDSHKFDLGWERLLELIEGFVGNLYDRGYVIAREDGEA